MIKLLKQIEENLPILIHPDNQHNWKSLEITYEEPHVWRLWIPILLENNYYRLCIHKIFKCKNSNPLYHPHDWPSAMKILNGIYIMNVGVENAILSTVELCSGSYYEMSNFKSFHSVNPQTDSVLSLMLMGNFYCNRLPFPKPSEKQKSLSDDMRESMFLEVSKYLDARNRNIISEWLGE